MSVAHPYEYLSKQIVCPPLLGIISTRGLIIWLTPPPKWDRLVEVLGDWNLNSFKLKKKKIGKKKYTCKTNYYFTIISLIKIPIAAHKNIELLIYRKQNHKKHSNDLISHQHTVNSTNTSLQIKSPTRQSQITRETHTHSHTLNGTHTHTRTKPHSLSSLPLSPAINPQMKAAHKPSRRMP